MIVEKYIEVQYQFCRYKFWILQSPLNADTGTDSRVEVTNWKISTSPWEISISQYSKDNLWMQLTLFNVDNILLTH